MSHMLVPTEKYVKNLVSESVKSGHFPAGTTVKAVNAHHPRGMYYYLHTPDRGRLYLGQGATAAKDVVWKMIHETCLAIPEKR